jgi:hypothetical protein
MVEGGQNIKRGGVVVCMCVCVYVYVCTRARVCAYVRVRGSEGCNMAERKMKTSQNEGNPLATTTNNPLLPPISKKDEVHAPYYATTGR